MSPFHSMASVMHRRGKRGFKNIRNGVGFWKPQSLPPETYIPSPIRSHFLLLPEQFHQLGASIQIYEPAGATVIECVRKSEEGVGCP